MRNEILSSQVKTDQIRETENNQWETEQNVFRGIVGN